MKSNVGNSKYAPGSSLRLLDLLVSVGDGLRVEVEVVAEVLNTSIGKSVVEPLPREDRGDEAAGLKRLEEHHDLEVGNALELSVLGGSSVLGASNDALLEEQGVDRETVLTRNKHPSPIDENMSATDIIHKTEFMEIANIYPMES